MTPLLLALLVRRYRNNFVEIADEVLVSVLAIGTNWDADRLVCSSLAQILIVRPLKPPRLLSFANTDAVDPIIVEELGGCSAATFSDNNLVLMERLTLSQGKVVFDSRVGDRMSTRVSYQIS